MKSGLLNALNIVLPALGIISESSKENLSNLALNNRASNLRNFFYNSSDVQYANLHKKCEILSNYLSEPSNLSHFN